MSYFGGIPVTVSSSSKKPILLYSETRPRGEVSALNEMEMLDHVIVRFERINPVLAYISMQDKHHRGFVI